MKTKIKLSRLIVVLFFSFSLMTNAQDVIAKSKKSDVELKLLGVGLHIEQFKFSDLALNFALIPANKIMLTLNVTKNIRIEPEFGYSSINNKTDDLKSNGSYYGLGIFGMYQRGITNIYLGGRFEYAFLKNEYFFQSIGKNENKYDRFSFQPTLGAELYFAQHFSIGGELGIIFMSIKSKNNKEQSEYDKSVNIYTSTGLLLRFYF